MKLEFIDRNRLLCEFVFEIFTGLYVIATVLICWKIPALAIILLTLGLGMQFFFWREKADVVMMIGAAFLGTPSEMLCVKLGVWSYHAPGLFLGIPVWIPLVWAYLFCFLRRLSITIHSAIQRIWKTSDTFALKLIYGILSGLIIIYYIITVSLVKKQFAIIYSLFMITAMIFWHRQKDILIFVIGGVIGTFGEFICMKLGFWNYHYPYLRSIGLPLSLPLAWGLSSVIIGNIARIWEA